MIRRQKIHFIYSFKFNLLYYLNFFVAVLLSTLLLFSCSDIDMSKRLSDEQREEARQQSELEQLKSYSQSGKKITGIKQINSGRQSERDGIGWQLSFNDGTTMTVTNGNNVDVLQTPYLRINGTGEWTVTYNGNDFIPLVDNEGDAVIAFSDDYTSQDYNRITYVGNSDGEMNFTVWSNSGGKEINKIKVPLESNYTAVIQCIVRDDISRELTLILSDGTIVTFGIAENDLKRISAVNDEPVVLNSENRTVTFDIKVTPENAFFNHTQLEINFSRGVWALNNGTYPVHVTSIVPAKNENGDLIEGQYTVTVEDMGDNILAYDEDVYLTLTKKDAENNTEIIESDRINIRYESEFPFLNHTGLPLVVINTPEHKDITSKDIWMEDVEMKVYDEKGKLDYEGSLQMKGRGNTTWGQVKKPYALKLDSKSKILGMPKHKRWVLLANHFDKSSLRTEAAFYMGRQSMAIGYTPRTKYVEFVFNGKHKGIYQVTEQLKIDENRVNVGDDGFLMEIDSRAGQDPEDIFFRVPHIPRPIVIKDPDVVVGDGNYNYLINFMNKVDGILFSSNYLNKDEGYKEFIDIKSFVDWYLVNEITKNNDAIFFSSCFMNLSRSGKLKMGPLWDFDLAIGNYTDPNRSFVNNTSGFYIYPNISWYQRFFTDPEFVSLVKERFNFYYNNRQDLYNYLAEQKALIDISILENEIIWGRFGSRGDKERTAQLYKAECDKLVSWLEERFQWLKVEFDKM